MVKENSVEKESRSFLVRQRENGKPHKLDQGTSGNLASLGITRDPHTTSVMSRDLGEPHIGMGVPISLLNRCHRIF